MSAFASFLIYFVLFLLGAIVSVAAFLAVVCNKLILSRNAFKNALLEADSAHRKAPEVPF